MAPATKKPRGPSAYFIFTEEKRPQVMARLQAESENRKAAAPAIAKALGEMWGSMSEEEKEAYRKKAKDRANVAAAGAAENGAAAGHQEQEEVATDAPTAVVSAVLPKHIVKHIMLTDDEVQRVSADALWAVAEAARLFVQHLAVKGAAAAGARKRKTIKLEDFEHVVRRDKRLVTAGLKDVVSNKRLFESHGAAANAAAARTAPGKAAEAKACGSGSQEPDKQQQHHEGEQGGDAGEDAATATVADQQPELTDEERIALEEATHKRVAKLMKARAAKAAERKKQKAVEVAKNTHKITTFFVSSKPDQFV